ncbi:hypothetical protein TRFO_14998 [Tritrichomonas foetus]|uniref:EF-hand domain-containing protein n=1 Tax=Tritrichomonas foetus TaxID=1144522 RepID=A0A1J4KYF0_9EUKA|nr:hypothetical protein TRFO_14998 [Tritrichomonas foetus]|eukprot:OHT14589.1 hypothetical protein TRFO_14998 [Tritrichomonas foetus]
MTLSIEESVVKFQSLGMIEEANYFQKLISEKKKSKFAQQIPNLIPAEKNPENSFTETFLRIMELKRRSSISSFVLKPNDITLFESELGLPYKRAIPYKSINWPKLRQNVKNAGQQFYLTDNFIKYFIDKKQNFKSLEYMDCLRLLSRIFDSYKYMDSIENIEIDGSLNEAQISNFIEVMIPHIYGLQSMGSHTDYYIPYATSLMMFFLTSFDGDKVFVRRFFSSKYLIKFINLAYEDETKNPFQIQASRKAYRVFMQLDSQKTGYLTQSDVKEFERFSFTDAFIHRLFNDVFIGAIFNEGRLDYTLYLNFYLAVKYMKSPRSVDLLFQVADIDGDGIIGNFDILYFYKAMIKELGNPKHNYDTFLSELLDYTKSSALNGITKEQIYKTRSGDPFFLLLFDKVTFTKWEEPIHET